MNSCVESGVIGFNLQCRHPQLLVSAINSMRYDIGNAHTAGMNTHLKEEQSNTNNTPQPAKITSFIF